MKWLLKALIQNAISVLPYSEDVNYIFQSKVAKNFPQSKKRFLWRVELAVDHFTAIQKHADDVAELRGYEFGAGWDMIIPLTYYSLGIQDQTITDIRPNLRFELVNDTIRRFDEYRPEIEKAHGVRLRELNPASINGPDDLESNFGIRYLTPCDARATGLPGNSFDFITSTYTLEHIPQADILAIMKECYRLLKPSGVLSSLVDMQDHYADFGKVSVYNYLQFPGWVWGMINSSIHYQNRLRYSDYRDIMNVAGFHAVEEWVDRPTEEDLGALRSLRLAQEFTRYSEDDLAAKRLRIVTERPALT